MNGSSCSRSCGMPDVLGMRHGRWVVWMLSDCEHGNVAFEYFTLKRFDLIICIHPQNLVSHHSHLFSTGRLGDGWVLREARSQEAQEAKRGSRGIERQSERRSARDQTRKNVQRP